MRNYPEWMLAFTAATSVSAIAVAMNSLWNADEMAYGLTDSGAKVLFADAERLALLESMAEPIDGLQVVVRHTGSPAADVELPVAWQKLVLYQYLRLILRPLTRHSFVYLRFNRTSQRGVVEPPQRHRCAHGMGSWYGALTERPGNVVAPEEGSGLVPASLLGIPLFRWGSMQCSWRVSRSTQTVAMYKWDASVAAELIERERIVTFTGPLRLVVTLFELLSQRVVTFHRC